MSEKWLHFAEEHGFQCIPSPTSEREKTPGLSIPFCLQIEQIEGIVLPKRLSNRSISLKLNLCMYDAKNKRFFGRSWSTQPVARPNTANRKDPVEINQSVYFHSSSTETTTMILIELVAIDDETDNQAEFSCCWTYLAPFGNIKLLPDSSSAKSNLRLARVDMYQGSPRILLCIQDVISVMSSSSLRSLAGCHVHYALFVHSAMEPVVYLFPGDTFVGAWDQVPGLHGQSETSSAIDFLWRPQLSKQCGASIEKLSLNIFPNIEQFELELLDAINLDRQAKDNVTNDIMLKITERRLLVGIHNGWKFIRRPHMAYLDLESRQASVRGSSRRSSAQALTQLNLSTLIQINELVHHPLYAVVFMLEFVITWPLSQRDKMNTSVTKAQSETVLVSWGAWTPTSGASTQQQVEISMCGGAGPNPRQSLVYGGSADDDQRVGCGTITFRFTSQDFTRGDSQKLPSRRISAFSAATVSEAAAVEAVAQELATETQEEARSDVVSVSEAPEDPTHPGSMFTTPGPIQRPKTSTPADELRGSLSQLPFTPVTHVAPAYHAPLPTTLPHPRPPLHNTLPAVPRTIQARLHDAEFVSICDGRGHLPVDVDPAETVSVNPDSELQDELQSNQITIQFMAISQRPRVYAHSNQSQYELRPMFESVFFTFQFYRFSEATSERLSLVSEKTDFICILKKSQQQKPGLEIRYTVDPAEFEQNESRSLAAHLQTRSLQLDIWDGDSLLHLGVATLPLSHLIRQGRAAVQVTHNVPIVYTDYSDESSCLVGNLIRSGSVRPPGGVATEIRGLLHVRLVNVGAKSTITPQDAQAAARGSPGNLVPTNPKEGKERRRVRAQPLVEIDRDLASVLQSRKSGRPALSSVSERKQSMTLTSSDDEARKRKLKRMALVRKNETLTRIENSDWLSNKQRAQELRTIIAFRERRKDEKIAQALCESITRSHTVRARYGVAAFFEYALRNPYDSSVTLKIDWECADLTVITDVKEWRYFKTFYDVTTPLEEEMFSENRGHLEIFLKARETVYIPFKYQCLQPEKENKINRNIKISFLKSRDGRPVGILLVKIEPIPFSVDQTFRFQHPEQAFLKKSIVLPPWHILEGHAWVNDSDKKRLQLCCSDSNVVCELREGSSAEPSQIFLKVACQAAPSVANFFLLLYLDPFRAKPIQTWKFHIHSVQRIDFSATQGQTSHLSVILRGSSIPRVVQCYPSCPQQLVVYPSGPFQLSANAAHEIQLSLKSMETGTKFIFVNVVDVEGHCLVKNWLVCANSRPPVVTKAFEQVIRLSEMVVNKKITYQNPYSVSKRFHLFSTCPDIIQFKEDVFEVSGAQSHSIGLRFMPQSTAKTNEILIFINNDEDKTEECFCIKTIYTS